MDLLESNYRTWCAQNDVPVDDGPPEGIMEIDEETADDVEEWGGLMDVEDGDDLPAVLRQELDLKTQQSNGRHSKRRRKGKVAELVREKVRKVLEEATGLAEKRARLCDEADFLKLLWAFNEENIHFS